MGKPFELAVKNGDFGYWERPGMGRRGGGTGKWEKFMLIPAELGVRDARELGVRMEGPWEEVLP